MLNSVIYISIKWRLTFTKSNCSDQAQGVTRSLPTTRVMWVDCGGSWGFLVCRCTSLQTAALEIAQKVTCKVHGCPEIHALFCFETSDFHALDTW